MAINSQTENDRRVADFSKQGFFMMPGLVSPDSVPHILEELENAEDSDHYLDPDGRLRRMERVYDKGTHLKSMHQRIMVMLRDVFSDDFVIFKDKYNPKPPGGEGFFAHYDGVFVWTDADGSERQGWDEYAPDFFNVLVALDRCDASNGTLEIADKQDLPFAELLTHTKMNGTPGIRKEMEDTFNFNDIELNPGDAVVFSHKCPHRSAENKSDKTRRIIYYTYNRRSAGDNYDLYFADKAASSPGTGANKALSTRIDD